MKKYEYGYDIEKDIKELYGENYEQINNIRLSIGKSFLNISQDMRTLINIIQNPTPIKQQELDEWIKNKNIFLKTIEEQCNLIESFVRDYHIS